MHVLHVIDSDLIPSTSITGVTPKQSKKLPLTNIECDPYTKTNLIYKQTKKVTYSANYNQMIKTVFNFVLLLSTPNFKISWVPQKIMVMIKGVWQPLSYLRHLHLFGFDWTKKDTLITFLSIKLSCHWLDNINECRCTVESSSI